MIFVLKMVNFPVSESDSNEIHWYFRILRKEKYVKVKMVEKQISEKMLFISFYQIRLNSLNELGDHFYPAFENRLFFFF